MSLERPTIGHRFLSARNRDWESPARVAPDLAPDAPCSFEIYREDQVRLTATRLSGGDWHWRLSDAGGMPLVDAGGYRSEEECRKAVFILRSESALATMPRRA